MCVSAARPEGSAMITKRYLQAYILFAVIGLTAVLVWLLNARNPSAMALVVGVLVALAVPAALIWIFRKLGYPIGQAVNCARCGTEQPATRRPASVRQAMLGGYTCAQCGAELDAAGRVRS
jgi:hypothetical protein